MGYTCKVEERWETRQQGATLKIIQLFCPTMKSNPSKRMENGVVADLDAALELVESIKNVQSKPTPPMASCSSAG